MGKKFLGRIFTFGALLLKFEFSHIKWHKIHIKWHKIPYPVYRDCYGVLYSPHTLGNSLLTFILTFNNFMAHSVQSKRAPNVNIIPKNVFPILSMFFSLS